MAGPFALRRLPAWTGEHAARIVRLETEAFDAHMRYDAAELAARAAEPGALLLVAEDADGLAAFVLGACDRTRPDAWFLDRLVVAPASRGRGLGRAAVAAAAEHARALGKPVLTVTVDPRNRASPDPLGFYRGLGFVESARTDACIWLERAVDV